MKNDFAKYSRDRSDDTKQYKNVCKFVAFQRVCSTASLFYMLLREGSNKWTSKKKKQYKKKKLMAIRRNGQ